MAPHPKGIPARFWPKVDIDGPVPAHAPHLGPCWIWTAKRTSDGYGQLRVGSWTDGSARTVLVHRWAYEALVGPIPDGLQIDHLCRVPRCVNPGHLEPVTRRENVLRGTGPAAVNARKTHCVNGHPFDAANTYWTPRGRRDCRACRRRAVARYHESRRRAS